MEKIRHLKVGLGVRVRVGYVGTRLECRYGIGLFRIGRLTEKVLDQRVGENRSDVGSRFLKMLRCVL